MTDHGRRQPGPRGVVQGVKPSHPTLKEKQPHAQRGVEDAEEPWVRLKPRRLGRGQRDRRYPAGARGLPGTPGPTPLKRQHELGENRLQAPDSAGRKHPPHNRTRGGSA